MTGRKGERRKEEGEACRVVGSRREPGGAVVAGEHGVETWDRGGLRHGEELGCRCSTGGVPDEGEVRDVASCEERLKRADMMGWVEECGSRDDGY